MGEPLSWLKKKTPGRADRDPGISCTSAGLEARKRDSATQAWIELVRGLGPDSCLLASATASLHAHEHLARQVHACSPNVLCAHIRTWHRWAEWCGSLSLSCTNPGLSVLLDYLWEQSHGGRGNRKSVAGEFSKATCMRGLRFVAHKAQLAALSEDLHSQAVKGYETGANIPERREALPFPLQVVLQWERTLVSGELPLPARLFLGALLAMCWASMRWSDIQRTRPASLSLAGGVLRGSCWKSKNCKQGFPWGVQASGFEGKEQRGWPHVWIASLHEWLASLPAGVKVDYLLPDMPYDQTGRRCLVARPCSYAVALCMLRTVLHGKGDACMGWPSDRARSYTLHGLKATLLSWARQRAAPPEDRADQGHHRNPSGSGMVPLYSRDDVFGALRVQSEIISAVRSGWRPLAAQSRGGQQPQEEPSCSVHAPATSPRASEPPSPSLVLEPTEEVPSHGAPLSSVGESSSSTDLSDPDSSADSESEVKCRYLLNTCSDVLHVAVPQAAATARRSLHEDGQDWAAACGVQLSLDKSCYELLDIAPASALPCRRPACQRALGLREPARSAHDDASSDAVVGDD